jgi:hypothetical protein
MDRVLGIRFDPPMAIARIGAAGEPVAAYRWKLATDPHRGMQTMIVPAPSLVPRPLLEAEFAEEPFDPDRPENDGPPCTLDVVRKPEVTFKDEQGRVRPVAPFFALVARLQDSTTGEIREEPLTPALLERLRTALRDLRFRVTAANRKAEARTGDAACAAIARVDFDGDDFRRKRLLAISPHTEGQVQFVSPEHPLPLGWVQIFAPREDSKNPNARLDQLRLRFTPGSGDTFGPPNSIEAPASPLAPGVFEPAVTEYGRIHTMTKPENRFLQEGTPWSGYNFRSGGTPKWPTPMDSYDGARVGSGNGWGLIDDTCDVLIEVELTAQGAVFAAAARAFAGPPDFAPDRRPFYSIKDELEDRDLPPAEPAPETTPREILDLFRRVFETASLLNLDQRRDWALNGNPQYMGQADPDAPDWDQGISPRLGPKSMREADKPYADLVPEYTPGQGDTTAPVSGPNDRLPYTQVVNQVHARLADSPILQEFLARRPDRVRRLVRPPFAKLSDLPKRVGAQKPAAVPMKHPPEGEPIRYRDPRGLLDQLYDMRMPPYMRHSMGVPLSITRRQFDLLMAYLDRLEADPEWGAAAQSGAQDDDA